MDEACHKSLFCQTVPAIAGILKLSIGFEHAATSKRYRSYYRLADIVSLNRSTTQFSCQGDGMRLLRFFKVKHFPSAKPLQNDLAGLR